MVDVRRAGHAAVVPLQPGGAAVADDPRDHGLRVRIVHHSLFCTRHTSLANIPSEQKMLCKNVFKVGFLKVHDRTSGSFQDTANRSGTDPELEFDREVYPIGISLAEIAIIGAACQAAPGQPCCHRERIRNSISNVAMVNMFCPQRLDLR